MKDGTLILAQNKKVAGRVVRNGSQMFYIPVEVEVDD